MEQRPAVVITILEQSLVITAGKFRNPAPEVLETRIESEQQRILQKEFF